jgi:dissimilatory sulfite reductase (desulfoviridin) alpha/beta subunit
VDYIREICDLADKYCDGYLRFTSRHNVEFLLSDEANVEPLLDELKQKGFLWVVREILSAALSTLKDGFTAIPRPLMHPVLSRP